MIDVLLYDRDKKEQNRLCDKVRDTVALLSDDRMECVLCESAKQVEAHLVKDPPLDLSMLEVAEDNDIALTRQVRSFREQSDIMLMADGHISPMKYLTPGRRACSLLLKTFTDEEMNAVVREFIASHYRKRETPSDENTLVIENREGRVVVPLSHIYYIEAREKKVFFRLRDREYCKYDTLENVKTMLPDGFVQSHRSFVFNTQYLDRIKLSENAVYLENGIIVPLSRSFKASVKEYLNGLSGKRNHNTYK